jgi:predicted Ser/Thr protein kinase
MATTADEMTEDAPAFPTVGRARTVVAGHYEVDLDDPLGSGGMALVYRGRDLRTRRTIALKTLRIEYRRDPESRARFRREARTMAFLQHPNVARVFDLYEDSEAPWAILEYVPGRSLKEEIAAEGPFDLETTAHILDQIAGALTHLHRRGLVHLDVKPQNLIVTADRTVKLIDFGLAQRAGQPQEMIGGLTFGTAAYLSPEQACGEPVDVTTDVYALGCVVYELVTGGPPFATANGREDKNDVIRAHLDRAPTPPTKARPDLNLPAWVDDVVLWALAKQQQDRYSDTDAFARLFRSGLDGTIAESEAATAHLATATVIDTHQVGTKTLTAPDLGARIAGALYRAVGRRLRRAEGLRRRLWRIAFALALANLLLALALFVDRGEVPGLIAGDATLHAGGRARVVANSYRLRAEPGLDTAELTSLDAGDQLTITGEAVNVDGLVWWPAEVDENGQTLDGYIAQDGIAAVPESGLAWLTDLLDLG